MANTRQIKRRISAANNISKITKAMEMVAASKMRRSIEQALLSRPYSRTLENSLHKLSSQSKKLTHPLLQENEQGQDLLIMIATDKGLCGSLNAQLYKNALHWQEGKNSPLIIAVGKKAVYFAKVAGIKLEAEFVELNERVGVEEILPISRLIMDGYSNQKYKSVTLLYTDFINTLSHAPRSIQLLPFISNHQPNGNGDRTLVQEILTSEYAFEPSAEKILSEILPFYIENTLYQSVLESRASEHSARMVTMKNASENAHELVDELSLEFNKSRQSAITNELLDITTSSLTIN